jgi:hypothetical protein
MHDFLEDVQRQCTQIHNAVQRVYIDYPIDAAVEA